MTTLTIHQPYQTAFTVVTDCDALVRSLRLKYGVYIQEGGSDNTLTITVKQNNTAFLLYFQEEQLETDCPLTEIDCILFEHTVYDSNIFAMHGAAVAWKNQVSIFLAATTGGKTTLASYLTAKGFGYMTDDCILLDKATLEVHPFSTPVFLRDGGLEVLRALNAAPANLTLLDAPAFRRYVHTPDHPVTEALPLHRIFFITRTEHTNQLQDMPTNQRIQGLMASPITNYPVTGDYLRFLSRLAQTDCRRLYYSDLEFVEEVLKG